MNSKIDAVEGIAVEARSENLSDRMRLLVLQGIDQQCSASIHAVFTR